MGQATSTIFRCISSCCDGVGGDGGGGGGGGKQQDHPGLRGILQSEEEIRQSETLHSLQKPLVLHPTIPTPQQPCRDFAVTQGFYLPTFITDPSIDESPDLLSLDITEDLHEDEEEEGEEVIWEAWDTTTGGVCISHYCSSHTILLVGEGDFSFSASLAAAFGTAYNITATSLDSIGKAYITCI